MALLTVTAFVVAAAAMPATAFVVPSPAALAPTRGAQPTTTRSRTPALAPCPQLHPPRSRAAVVVEMGGFFDVLKKAFANELFDDRRVRASHILVKTEDEAAAIKAVIDAGEKTFADAARESSSCPSKKDGGSLGAFGPGKMVQQFDDVCFDESIEPGSVVGPVKTVFGFHLIKIEERFLNRDKSEGSPVF